MSGKDGPIGDLKQTATLVCLMVGAITFVQSMIQDVAKNTGGFLSVCSYAAFLVAIKIQGWFR